MLRAFVQAEAERLASALAVGRAAIRLDAMFLVEDEIGTAAECFAQKFAGVGQHTLTVQKLTPRPTDRRCFQFMVEE